MSLLLIRQQTNAGSSLPPNQGWRNEVLFGLKVVTAAAMLASATTAASATVAKTGAAPVSANVTLTATASVTKAATAPASVTATLGAAASVTRAGDAPLAAVAALTATALVTKASDSPVTSTVTSTAEVTGVFGTAAPSSATAALAAIAVAGPPRIARQGTTFTQAPSASGSITVPYPATVAPGSLAVMIIRCPVAGLATTPAGWNAVASSTSGGLSPSQLVCTRVTDGTEGGTAVVVSTPSSIQSATMEILGGAQGVVDVQQASSSTAVGTHSVPQVAATPGSVVILAAAANGSTAVWGQPAETAPADWAVGGTPPRGTGVVYRSGPWAPIVTLSPTARSSVIALSIKPGPPPIDADMSAGVALIASATVSAAVGADTSLTAATASTAAASVALATSAPAGAVGVTDATAVVTKLAAAFLGATAANTTTASVVKGGDAPRAAAAAITATASVTKSISADLITTAVVSATGTRSASAGADTSLTVSAGTIATASATKTAAAGVAGVVVSTATAAVTKSVSADLTAGVTLAADATRSALTGADTSLTGAVVSAATAGVSKTSIAGSPAIVTLVASAVVTKAVTASAGAAITLTATATVTKSASADLAVGAAITAGAVRDLVAPPTGHVRARYSAPQVSIAYRSRATRARIITVPATSRLATLTSRARIIPMPLPLYVGDLLPVLRIALDVEGVPVDLTGASSITVTCARNGTILFTGRSATSPSPGVVQMSWQTPDTSVAGLLELEVIVVWPGALPQTYRLPTPVQVIPRLP